MHTTCTVWVHTTQNTLDIKYMGVLFMIIVHSCLTAEPGFPVAQRTWSSLGSPRLNCTQDFLLREKILHIGCETIREGFFVWVKTWFVCTSDTTLTILVVLCNLLSYPFLVFFGGEIADLIYSPLPCIFCLLDFVCMVIVFVCSFYSCE